MQQSQQSLHSRLALRLCTRSVSKGTRYADCVAFSFVLCFFCIMQLTRMAGHRPLAARCAPLRATGPVSEQSEPLSEEAEAEADTAGGGSDEEDYLEEGESWHARMCMGRNSCVTRQTGTECAFPARLRSASCCAEVCAAGCSRFPKRLTVTTQRPYHCPVKSNIERLTVCKRACKAWFPLLAGDDSDHEFYGRLFGDPAGAQSALPAWAGGAGAYTPFEYIEFEDTEVHHDLEVTVSGLLLRLKLARPQGCGLSLRLISRWPDLTAAPRARCCLVRRVPCSLDASSWGRRAGRVRAQRSRIGFVNIKRNSTQCLAERHTGAWLVACWPELVTELFLGLGRQVHAPLDQVFAAWRERLNYPEWFSLIGQVHPRIPSSPGSQ